jgi:hypothetical protein
LEYPNRRTTITLREGLTLPGNTTEEGFYKPQAAQERVSFLEILACDGAKQRHL